MLAFCGKPSLKACQEKSRPGHFHALRGFISLTIHLVFSITVITRFNSLFLQFTVILSQRATSFLIGGVASDVRTALFNG